MAVREDVLSRVKAWRGYVEARHGFRNYWYPTLAGSEVQEKKPTPIQLLGENLLLNRLDGKLYCMRDRCMHRGVKFSAGRLECLVEGTITCWYHGWTYRWDSGELVGILTNPQSSQIGRHRIKTYPVQEAQGIAFVYFGDDEPPPLAHDVPPGFLDADLEVGVKHRIVKSNWRVGVENGFDAGHIWIHKDSVLVDGNDLALPLGFAPAENLQTTRLVEGANGPKGVYDLLGELSMPVFESYLGDVKVAEGHFGENRVANEISVWLPGALKVDPWPQDGMIQFEWYVPLDEQTHSYVQCLARRVNSEAERVDYRREFREKWIDLALDGFNNDDVWAREASEAFYANDIGWVEERLYEPDVAIVEWRKLASKHNRGIQTPENVFS